MYVVSDFFLFTVPVNQPALPGMCIGIYNYFYYAFTVTLFLLISYHCKTVALDYLKFCIFRR